ncbi:hypothetical protein ABVN58_11755 [Fusobacterium polymorphum]|uniref:Uncharacterized protein n=1 Tax=Fusobacterium nucleatum CTI-6 TaxID=1316587 RepID=U7TPJ3_FUSNU|nr:hypothetical protein [Fusobacterium nucleatum]ERT45812.1 hypothetical protein HMPREF1767_02240 [Fusobacterium nucleatum CTI-6]
MKTEQYIESRIAALDKLRKEALKEYETKLDNGIDDEELWQYISTKRVEIHTLKDILKD